MSIPAIVSPADLRAGLVTAMRSITGLVALVDGDSDNIFEYLHQLNGNYYGTLMELRPESLLVRHASTVQNIAGRIAWRHGFEIVVRTSGDPAAIYAAFMNGVPTGSGGLPMWRAEINSAYHPLENVDFRAQSLAINAAVSFDYWALTFNLDSKGVR